jgi:hypothetical protein
MHEARDFADKNQEKGKITCPPIDSPYIDQTGAIIIPFNADPNIIIGMAVSRWLIP